MSKNEIKQLEKMIDTADTNYHAFGMSDISDAEYDGLKDRLAKLDPTNSRLKQVGAKIDISDDKKSKKVKEKWEKYIHTTYKMGSVSKVNIFDQLQKWIDDTSKTGPWIVQEKMDGISIKLIYKNGKLEKAITRGNDLSGENVGEDITKNVLKMKGIPHNIKFNNDLIVRGEILLYKSNFDLVGGKTLRNSAAGTAKGYDGKNCEHLNIQCYSIMNWKELNIKTEKQSVEFLSDNGFKIINYYICSTIDEIETVYKDYIKNKRKKLDWDIDGLVIKYNEIEEDKWDLPERARAYKFPHETAVTKLLDVIWQDSGGRISPVALLEPININGVTISRATLNNIDYIKSLDIKINDIVLISRRNDVIPCIESVSIHSTDGEEILPPKFDEEGFPIVREKNAEGKELVYLVSTNPNSKQKKIRSILQWYKAHDSKGIAEETIDSIISEKIANSLPEFYDIGLNCDTRLATLEGFGAGKFKILNKATLLTSKTTIVKFMEGIDIAGFGSSRFEAILEYVNKKISITEFINICKNEVVISSISSFGSNTALSLKNSIIEKEKLIKEMLKRVEVEEWEPEKKTSSKINGLSFCFTGKMEYDRGVLEKSVKKNGGLVAGVSSKLDYLVVNDLNSDSNKNQKAIKLGIKRISEKEYLNMIGGISS